MNWLCGRRFLGLIWGVLLVVAIASCTQSDDGPISIYSDEMSGSGEGFVIAAMLDSGRVVHLRSESLIVTLDSVWSLANCFLKSIEFDSNIISDTILELYPRIYYEANSEDCAAPIFRPETSIFVPPSSALDSIREIRIFNSDSAYEDTVSVRSGTLEVESLEVYVDTSFAVAYEWPRRTAGLPSVFRLADSLKQRTYYWRPMKSTCTYISDTCETVPDTAYPSTWSLRDTNLVPIRLACADTSLRYCISSNWSNDSSSLGEVLTHLDTLWYSTWYIVHEMPDCGAVYDANYSTPTVKKDYSAQLYYFAPASEADCYSDSTGYGYSFYSLKTGSMVFADSLYDLFETANVGRDTL